MTTPNRTAPAADPDATSAGVVLGEIEADTRTWWERNREAFSLRSAGSIYALLLLVLFFTIRSAQLGRPFYLASANVGNLLEQASLIGIMAIGMTVLLISGNFDLSVASNAAMSSMVGALLAEHIGPGQALLVAVLVGTVGGLINGLIHWYVGLNSFIVTLGTLYAYRGVVLYINDGAEKVLAKEDRDPLREWFGGHIPEFPLFLVAGLIALVAGVFMMATARKRGGSVALALGLLSAVGSQFFTYDLRLAHVTVYGLVLLAIVWFVLRMTVTGRRLYATGGNIEAARAAGVNVALYVIVPFAVVGFCAGVAGAINTARVGAVPPTVFFTRELQVIASAIIGGVALTGGAGNVLKTMIGALLLFVMTNGFTIIGLSPFITQIAIGVLVILSAAAYVVAARRAAAEGRV